ncbi:MAG: ribonuclease D [Beijerinckiaceae bacterium]|nr:ribonuclease D [Beijerinckiaceae bacterium]
MNIITKSGDLAALCSRLAGHPYITVDTEFLRETTYYPKLCLIQMASADEIGLVDTLATGLDLAPFYALMANTAVIKVFHAARQDIEIIWHGAKVIPTPLFDTQVAAMVCGFGDQISYESLVASLAGAKIDKSSRFTDWARRPLSEAQIEYAASDVSHLRVAYEKLAERLSKTGRTDWLKDEMAVLTSPSTYEVDPERVWERLKTRIRKPRDLAILIELAAWREREAQARDVPRGRILKDDAIGEIALAAPRSVEELGRLRALSNGFERSKAGIDILEAVQRGIQRDPATLPPMRAERSNASNNAALVQLLKVLLQAVAERERVAARVIASSDDLEAIANGDESASPALEGWRREIFGLQALALTRGEIALTVKRGRIATLPIPSV